MRIIHNSEGKSKSKSMLIVLTLATIAFTALVSLAFSQNVTVYKPNYKGNIKLLRYEKPIKKQGKLANGKITTMTYFIKSVLTEDGTEILIPADDNYVKTVQKYLKQGAKQVGFDDPMGCIDGWTMIAQYTVNQGNGCWTGWTNYYCFSSSRSIHCNEAGCEGRDAPNGTDCEVLIE